MEVFAANPKLPGVRELWLRPLHRVLERAGGEVPEVRCQLRSGPVWNRAQR